MRQPRLAELVADALRRQILDGSLADGSLLPKQDELLDEFGVSPPSLREALRILETEGLITVRRGSVGGAVVHAPHSDSVAYMFGLVLQSRETSLEDVAAAIRQVEPDCAALCALREDREQTVVPLLAAVCDETEAAIDDAKDFTRLGRAFHEDLARLCGNDTMALVAGALETMWSVHERRWALQAEISGEFPEQSVRLTGVEAHRRILAAIAAGDPARAEVLVRKHFAHSCRYTLQGGIRVDATLLRDHGLSNPDR
jgi:DNA-binding FadR family transcriptional regulator